MMGCLCFLLIFVNLVQGFHHQLGYNPPVVSKGTVLPPERWFNQTLDHFDPTDNRTWEQRYYINDTFYEPGGPIFLMIGGEGPASAKWMVTGTWVEYAKTFNAYLVQLEHRFYGKSHPTQNLSVDNLRYLSSEQALADLAVFVTELKKEEAMNLTTSKVVAFGGSYPGSLAAWVRLKYPHLIHASVSSSAPLVAQINFKEYLEVVTASLSSKGSQSCVKSVNKAFQYISLLLQHRVGWKVISKSFSLCSPFNGLDTKDVANLFELLAEAFDDVVQYNEDNRDFEGAKGTNITIQTICSIMDDSSLGNALQRLSAVISLRLKTFGEKCSDHSYQSMIQKLQKIEWTNDTSSGGRQWTYQTCTEFGFYQTSDSTKQPFGHEFPLQFFVQQCADIFGKQFTSDMLERGVQRTNIIYGGRNPKVSRVVFVNGSIDPWHFLGVTKSYDDVPAIFINGTAHCANMYPAAPTDSIQLKEARQKVENIITKWLQE